MQSPRTSRSGVALVATLIMLSLVTFMVVAFLSVARRERQSVAASLTINEARSAMEAGLARAQGDVFSRLLTTGDPWSYGLMVPTNYQSPGWSNAVSPNNVNPTNALTVGVNAWLTNLGNLQFDARVPVFSPYYTNSRAFALGPLPGTPVRVSGLLSETNQGRYYLDFNRNGTFDPTDATHEGDPHWLGILEYPNALHHATNQFTSRYTYLVAPAGKALDLNLIHNAAKRRGSVLTPGLMNAVYTTYEGYYRNLGLAPYEFNLAAMLTELAPAYYLYNYSTIAANSSSAVPATRDSFRDAFDLFVFRANTNYNSIASNNVQFGANAWRNLTNSVYDLLGNGPLMVSTNLPHLTNSSDFTSLSWPGGSNAHAAATRFFDMNELFMTTRKYGNFTTNLNLLGSSNAATVAEDASRRTYYNLLSTLGVESWPQTDKLNLNWLGTRFLFWSNSAPGTFELVWSNAPSSSVGGEYFGFANWTPEPFFNTAAEQMLRASITPSVFFDTNWSGFGGGGTNVFLTNYYFGNTFVGTNTNATLSITNIPIFPASYYTPEVNRILQLAANIYDAAGPPEWINGVTYAVGDRVQRLGVNYVARVGNTSVIPPNAATWEAITGGPAGSGFLPTLFRPAFAFNTNGWPYTDSIRIAGYYVGGTDASTLLSLPVVDLNDPNSRMQMYLADGNLLGGSNFCLVAGTPVIVGARKGYPNFNEFAAQALLSVTRRLEFVKTNATNAGPLNLSVGRPLVFTNQSLILGMTNVYGFEAWNSYTGAFPRSVRLVATNVSDVAVGRFVNRHLTNSAALFSATNFMLLYTNRTINGLQSNIAANAWSGTANFNASFKSFFFTNVPQLSTNAAQGYAYATNYPPLPGFTNGGFAPASAVVPGLAIFNRSNGFPDLRLHVTITNSIRYALIEPAANRVVDFVNLANMVVGTNMLAQFPVVVAGGKWNRGTNGLLDGMEVQFSTTGTLPGGLATFTTYFVRDATTNDFNVSATSGGAAIALGGGAGFHTLIPPTDENLGLVVGTGGNTNGGQFWQTGGRGGGALWQMTRTAGISNQIAMCLETNLTSVSTNQWRQWSLNTPIPREIDRFRKWMGTNGTLPFNQAMNTNVASIQSPFNPTRVVSLSATWEANDPLVHYTLGDLENQFLPLVTSVIQNRTNIAPIGSLYRSALPNQSGLNFAYQPWGAVPNLARHPAYGGIANFRNAQGQGYYNIAPVPYDQRLKDPGSFRSDEWDFPQRKFANLGWLGRVHRGTPWQTFYLKSDAPNPTNWYYWAHSFETNPTNDWRLADVFTAAIDSDATRGLLSVNQTNSAAWAAGLASTLVLSNNGFGIVAAVIPPASVQLTNIMGGLTNGLMNARMSVPMWIPTANYSSNDIVSYWSGTGITPYFVANDPVPQTKRYYRALNALNYVQAPNQNQDPYLLTSSFSYAYWTNVFPWADTVIYPASTWVVYRDVSYFTAGGAGINLRPDITPAVWEAAPVRSFTKKGYVLRTPELSVQSPYLNVGRPWVRRAYLAGERVYWQGWYYQAARNLPLNTSFPDPRINYHERRGNGTPMYGPGNMPNWWPLESAGDSFIIGDSLNDVFVERIPQQTFGLMQLETSPRVVIYAYGQSLKPAERGVFVGGGAYQGMVTNYQITGEQASRALVRIDGLPEPGLLPPLRVPAIYPPLYPGSYPVPAQVFPRVIIESF
ncbi:MAG: hypothetical protein HZA92_00670, partial [Verrucomicrobia bacterium]|nr:hypothetical protein [Verrucomicrobiota bacterium]